MRFYRFEKCVVNLNNIKYIEYETPYGFNPYYSIHFFDHSTLAISEEAYKELMAYLLKNNDVNF